MKPESAALPGRLGILPWTSSAQCSPCLNTSCREHRGGAKKSWILCRGLKLTKPAQPGGERGAGLECVREERGRPRCRCVRGCLSALSSALPGLSRCLSVVYKGEEHPRASAAIPGAGSGFLWSLGLCTSLSTDFVIFLSKKCSQDVANAEAAIKCHSRVYKIMASN